MKKAWFIYTSCFMLTFMGLVFNYVILSSFTSKQMNQAVVLPPSEKRVEAVSFKKKDSFTVLLMGTDKRAGDRGRTDTLLLASVSSKSMNLLSIPRDTRVAIPGLGKADKINHAYAYGGTKLTIKTVEAFLNVPVDYFVNVNMDEFEGLIDEAGGVSIENDLAFTLDGTAFPKKKLTLDGEKAMKYIRMRYDDPNGDFGRQDRQHKVLYALLEKEYTLSRVTSLFSRLHDRSETNFTLSKLLYLHKNYNEARYNLSPLYMNGSGKKIDNTYYFTVSEEERNRLSRTFRKHLELSYE